MVQPGAETVTKLLAEAGLCGKLTKFLCRKVKLQQSSELRLKLEVKKKEDNQIVFESVACNRKTGHCTENRNCC